MMMRTTKLIYVFGLSFFFAAAVAFPGCGGGGSGLDTVPVSGTVTLDGQPVQGAAVTFSPEGEGRAAAGVTDASGRYELTTVERGDGALPGSYKVMISKYEAAPRAPEVDDVDAAYAAAEAAGQDISGRSGTVAPKPKSLIPERYANIQTSGLTATITDQREGQQFDFTLQQ